ncbi:MAG: hypothetical protein AAGB31_11775 [Bdellovibrio sp.]
MEVQKKLQVKEGKVKVEIGAEIDGDLDGVIAAKGGAFVEVDIAEALKEVAVANDLETAKKLLPYMKQVLALVPDYEAA